MKLSTTLTAMGLLGVMAAAALTPQAAFASESNSQKNKNNWRNGAIAGGAVALYGLTKHNKTATIVGAAGAAYSAKRYEDDRHHQSQRKAARARYHRLHHTVRRHK